MKTAILILTCLAGSPEDCTEQTALDVRTAAYSGLPMQCAMAGLTAASSDPRTSASGLQTKIICGGRAK